MRSLVTSLLIGLGFYAQFKVTEQSKADETKLDQVFNTAADSMRVIDKDFNVLRVNDTFKSLAKTSGDTVGTKCYEIFHSSRCHSSDCSLTQILQGEERVEYEDERQCVDGSEVHCIVTATPFRDADGELIGIVEDFKDITDRKKVEERLRESEERYRTTFEHTGTAMMVIEEDTTISMVNKVWEELSGYSKEEIIGRSWTEFVHSDDLERMLGYHYARRKGEDAPKKYEFKFVGREGNVKDMIITIDLIPGTKKSVASLMDITRLRRLNSLLQAVSEINEVLAREKEPENIMDAVCEKLPSLYECVSTSIIKDGELTPVRSEGISIESINSVINKCPSVSRAMEGKVAKMATDSELRQHCSGIPHNYVLSIPLIHEKQQGVITVHSNSEFSGEEVGLLEKLADNIAFALAACKVKKDKEAAVNQLIKNLNQFDRFADRLRNPLAVIMSTLELRGYYREEQVIETIQEQAERIKEELDALRREETSTFELVDLTEL